MEHRPWGQNEGHHHPRGGNGQDRSSAIIAASRGSSVPFELQGVEGKPFRVTGITFDGTGWADAGLWGGFMSISGTCKNFRIDHCKFKNASVMMTIKRGETPMG